MGDHIFNNRYENYGEQDGHPHGPTPVSTRIMIAAVVVLFVVVLFIVLLHIYARWFWRAARLRSGRGGWSRRRRRFHFAEADITPVNGAGVIGINKGLDKSVLETLPIFYYTDKMEEEGRDCAVCLSEFVENEAGRRLPRCNHVFHTECIDMWFGSHSTCPLCRANVISVNDEQGKEGTPPQAGEELLREAVMVGLQGRGEENSIAIQILQEEGAVLLTESGREPRAHRQDHVVVNVDAPSSLNSPRNGGCLAPSGPPSNSVNQTVQQSQFPASVLFWGSETYVSSASMTEDMRKVGTSASPSPRRQQLVIEVPRRSFGNFSTSACSSQLTSPTTTTTTTTTTVGEGQRSPGLGAHLRNLKRLLSPRRCSSPDCSSEQQQSFHSACHTPMSNVSGCQTPV